MCKNKKLKESLQSLSQSAYSLFNKELHLDDSYQNDALYISMALYKIETKVTEIPEFNICTDLMIQDEKIRALLGKLVGTLSGSSSIPNEKTCILSFLKQIYLESKIYDQGLFDRKYLSFEELFYSDHLVFKDIANLYNFSFDKDELVLGHGVIIRKAVEPINQQEEYVERIYRPHSIFSRSSCVIERNYERTKIIGENTDKDKTKISSELSETGDLFDLVINSLRVLKTSAVYRDHRIKTENITFHPFGGTSIRSPVYENTVVGEECKIETTDIDTLCNIFDFLCNENDSRFKVALRRLSLGIERKNPEDKLIDFMIGLEALYLPDGNAELSFRLSVRVAFLLFSGIGKKDAFNFLRKMYDVRSSIVHGNKYELNTEDIKKLEELLRKSVTLWMEDKRNFSVTEKTNSGKVKSEGKLDTMLFDI